MKKTLYAAILCLGAFACAGAFAAPKGTPPGLAKKGGMPPGQAKKYDGGGQHGRNHEYRQADRHSHRAARRAAENAQNHPGQPPMQRGYRAGEHRDSLSCTRNSCGKRMTGAERIKFRERVNKASATYARPARN